MTKPSPRRAAKLSSRKPAREFEHEESTDQTTSRSANPRKSRSASNDNELKVEKFTGNKKHDSASPNTSEPEPENDPKDKKMNGEKKDETPTGDTTGAAVVTKNPKLQSADAIIRDAGQKLLSSMMKQEWTSIDPVLKQLEKIVADGGDETNIAPLAGVSDPVSVIQSQNSALFALWNGNITTKICINDSSFCQTYVKKQIFRMFFITHIN